MDANNHEGAVKIMGFEFRELQEQIEIRAHEAVQVGFPVLQICHNCNGRGIATPDPITNRVDLVRVLQCGLCKDSPAIGTLLTVQVEYKFNPNTLEAN